MNKDLVFGLGLVVVILGTIVYSGPRHHRGPRKEGFVDTGDYTKDYAAQIETWATMEESALKLPIEALAKATGYTLKWKPGVDKSTIAARREGLPEPEQYLAALMDIDRGLGDQLAAQDEELEITPDINKKIMAKQLEIKEAIETATGVVNLPSLSSLHDRGTTLLGRANDIAALLVIIPAKMGVLAANRTAPSTPEAIIEYEINKFAKPSWGPIKMVVERLAKLLGMGADGQPIVGGEQAALDAALKDIAEGSQVNDFADYYKMMSTAGGNPKPSGEVLKDLFDNPLGYINVLKYIQGRGAAALSGSTISGFTDMTGSKCVACLIEPEVKDIDGLRRRYVVLRDLYKEFKGILAAVEKTQAAAAEIEKKAASGELTDEFLASGKFKVE
jgi:hypothetical protein